MSRANAEQAITTWLESVSSLPDSAIAMELPELANFIADDTGPRGFCQVTGLGGPVQNDLPIRQSVAQLDFYAGTKAKKPAWSRAAALADEVFTGTQVFTPVSLTVTSWAGVDDVVVMQATPTSEPSRVRNDPQNLARFTMDVVLTWR